MRHFIGWVLAGTLASFAAIAAEESAQETTGTDAPVARAGQRAVLDPVTKRPTTPTTVEQKSRQAFGLPRPRRELMWVEHRPTGEKMLHTEGQARMATFARLTPDGEAEVVCVPGSPGHAAHDHVHADGQHAEGRHAE